MKLFLLTLLSLFLPLHSTWAKAPAGFPGLDAPIEEYFKFASRNLPSAKKVDGDIPSSPYVNQAVEAGGRNYHWLDFMNANRRPEERIFFTQLGELPSYPIEAPTYYSPQSIESEYLKIQAEIPQAMKAVIFEGADYTQDPPLPMDEYLLWARRVNRMYETATRWNSILEYMDLFRDAQYTDIRGYYYLGKEENLEYKLRHWPEFRRKERIRLKAHLINQCENSKATFAVCEKEYNRERRKERLWDFYQKYQPIAKKIYDDNFKIQDTDARKDITWTEENKMLVPFHHTDLNIEDFLSLNLEDEWKWGEWNLRLNFTDTAEVRVDFQVGVIPHVSPDDTNVIVMDKNTPLDEWNTQYTIRHEFGHILGFPDCYVEFYDKQKQEMVGYQLDITNMMCSRAGRMRESLYKELKRVYYKPSVSN